MDKSITISGMTVITVDENRKVRNIQFLPDDELAPIMEVSSHTYGSLQQLRNGAYDYVVCRPLRRAQSTLLRKAAHGRISATKDGAYQLTLKVFKREGLDVKETLTREAFDLINNVNF